MRTDVYTAMQDAAGHIITNNVALSTEDQRLVDKMVLEGKRAGLGLSVDQQEKLKDLKKELSTTQIEFDKNCDEEDGHITFTREQLEGVPRDVISGYKSHADEAGRDLLDVPFKTTDIFPVVSTILQAR
jgi:Zn-dependent oligopeptidase